MPVFEFSCPTCAQTLRARDQSVAGEVIVCGDCNTPLIVEQDGNGQLFARKQQADSPFANFSPPSAEATAASAADKPVAEMVRDRHAAYAGVGTAGLIVLLAVFYWWGRLSTVPEESLTQTVNSDPIADETGSDDNSDAGVNAETQLPNDKPNPHVYSALDVLLKGYREQTGHFPAPPQSQVEDPVKRLSWIAALETLRDPDRLPPAWNRSWDDPLNEHFVRRSLPHWLNPAINRKTSPNQYPASHFVGIAGVGQDAASLAASHPRAGLFGYDRRFSWQDLPAGASNVWMLSGVQSNFGSWAANGSATIRAWTGGEIIDGPDGFGTGDVDEMSILMADGSVRSLSVETDPTVLERLATVHAEHHSQIAGIPHPDLKAEESPPAVLPAEPNPGLQFGPLQAPKPPEAALKNLIALLRNDLEDQQEPPLPKIEIEEKLSQKLLLFDLRESRPLRDVLDQLEEMTGVPIVTDRESLGDAADRVDSDVRLSLIKPTLQEILEQLLQRAMLGYRIEGGRIVITSEPIMLEP